MRTILLGYSAVFVLLSSACEGLGNQPPQRASLPSNPHGAVTTFLRSLESGRYEAAATLLVDANGKPLDNSSRSAHIQAWRAAWGAHPDIHITEIRFVDELALSDDALAKLHATRGYKLTFNTLGRSATPCFRVPVADATMVAISAGAAWRPVEEFQSQHVPSLCIEQKGTETARETLVSRFLHHGPSLERLFAGTFESEHDEGNHQTPTGVSAPTVIGDNALFLR